MENKFYIYAHINPLKNEIFYIGKGTGKRAYSKSLRNKFWHNTVKKYGYIIDIIESNLLNEDAYKKEIFYINKIGRKDLGLGSLVNMTDGGDGGCPGRIDSIETREKRSKSLKGKVSPFKGKKLPKELYDSRRGENHPLFGTKKPPPLLKSIEKGKQTFLNNRKTNILQFDLNNNFIKRWNLIVEIEKELGFGSPQIGRACNPNHKAKTAYGYIWKYEKI